MNPREIMAEAERWTAQAVLELDLQAHLLAKMEPGTWPADSEMGRRWRLIEDTKARADAFQELARLAMLSAVEGE